MVFLAQTCANGQTYTWHNDWIVQSPPSSQHLYGPIEMRDDGLLPGRLAAFAPNGDVILQTYSAWMDQQFIDVAPDGSLRWQANLGWLDSGYSLGDILPTADGGAVVTTGFPGSIARLDNAGNVAWLRKIDSHEIVQVSSHTIATAGYMSLNVLDSETSQTLWSFVFGSPLAYDANVLAADSAGNVFLVVKQSPLYNPTPMLDVYKFNSTGALVWHTEVSHPPSSLRLMAVSDTQIYIANADGLVALRSGDASLAWIFADTAIQNGILLMGGSPVEPIVVSPANAQRLSASTGQPRWTQSLAGSTTLMAVVNGGALYANDLYKLDVETGDVSWSATLPSSYYGALGFSNGSLLAERLGIQIDFVKIDPATGNAGTPISIASSHQGVEAFTTTGPNGATYDFGEVVGSNIFRLRRLNPSTGSTVWETSSDVGVPFDGSWVPYATANASALFVADTPNDATQFWLGAFDSGTGSKKWDFREFQPGQELTYAAQPLLDNAGDVFAAYGTNVSGFSCPLSCSQRALLKLSAADGSVLWRVDSNGNPGLQIFPWVYSLLGSDLIVGDFQAHQYTKLSGVDGSILWTADPLTFSAAMNATPDGRLLVANNDGWAELDPATGHVLWMNQRSNLSPTNQLNDYGDVMAANGDLLGAGDTPYQGWVDLLPGHANATEKLWLIGPSNPAFRTSVLNIAIDTNGDVWLRIKQSFRRNQYMTASFLTKFNTQTGARSDQQFLYAGDGSPATNIFFSSFWAAPEDNRLQTSGELFDAPNPTTTRDALLDTTITARGDLALSATAGGGTIKAGDTVNFHFTVNYTGDTAISNAHLIADFPWPSIPTNLTCTASSGGSCTIVSGEDTLRATFNVRSGGNITLSGQIKATAVSTDLPELHGVVYGPTGLAESDTLNNFGFTAVTESLFKNGFEPGS